MCEGLKGIKKTWHEGPLKILERVCWVKVPQFLKKWRVFNALELSK